MTKSIRAKTAVVLVLSMAAVALSASSVGAEIPTPGGQSENVDGYLRFGVGLGLNNGQLEGVGPEIGNIKGVSVEGAAGLTFDDRVRWDVVSLAVNLPDEVVRVGALAEHVEGTRLDMTTGIAFGDFSPDRKLHPYLSVGLGLSRYTESGYVDWGFAWNAGAGLEYQLTDTLSVGPRYTFRQGLFVYEGLDATLNTHEFTLSVRWGSTR
ncbi:MAG: outer membrane beta-barrel protein [Myxococcota bacterium]|nr:outer membrane beta-barrel protein [Myxococcota bacterium]